MLTFYIGKYELLMDFDMLDLSFSILIWCFLCFVW